jgi:hypothetical protein
MAPNGVKTREIARRAITNSLNSPTITPNFGQPLVTLHWDKAVVASRPGPVRAPDSSAPQPPGVRSAGPVEFRVRFNPLMPPGRLVAGPIFLKLIAKISLMGKSSSQSLQRQASDRAFWLHRSARPRRDGRRPSANCRSSGHRSTQRYRWLRCRSSRQA